MTVRPVSGWDPGDARMRSLRRIPGQHVPHSRLQASPEFLIRRELHLSQDGGTDAEAALDFLEQELGIPEQQ